MNEEALILALPKGPDKLLRMMDFVKKTYHNHAIPDIAMEWFARDRCDMELSKEDIKERLDEMKEEEDKYLARLYSDEQLSTTADETADETERTTDGPE